MKKVTYKSLLKYTNEIFANCNLDDFSRTSVSQGLVNASLRGVDSHGVRLVPHYVNSARLGRKNPRPSFKINNKYQSTLSIDADNAFGLAAGKYAIQNSIKVAEKTGVCISSVYNSSHPGALASIAIPAAKKGFICFAFTNADSLVMSDGGVRPFFGTNPICFAAPRKDEEPFCVDMALSKTNWNKILMSQNNNQDLEQNIAADENGKETIDPHKAHALFPIGGYKGFALVAMVEVLCGILSGSPFGRDIPSMYKAPMNEPRNISQFYIIFQSDFNIHFEDYLKWMDDFTEKVRSEPSLKNNQVLLPNDPQIISQKIRSKEGIPIDDQTLKSFDNLKKELQIKSNIDFL